MDRALTREVRPRTDMTMLACLQGKPDYLENELAGDGRMVEALQAFKAGTLGDRS